MGFLARWKIHSPVLFQINLTGPINVVATHESSLFDAAGVDQYGSPIAFVGSYTTDNPSVATVDSSTRTAQGIAAGTAHIRVTSGAIQSNIIALVVAAQVATIVNVNPPIFNLTSIGGQTPLTVSVVDQAGGPIVSPTIIWTSSDHSIATVDSTGLVTAVANGFVTITATCGSVSDTSDGTVSAGASSFDPTDANTGAGILQSNGAVPYWFDFPRKYSGAGYTSPDDQWRKTQISSSLAVLSDASLKGGATPGAWNPYVNTGPRYGDGSNPDLIRLVAIPDPSFGPSFNEPCFEATIFGDNQPHSAPVPNIRSSSFNQPYNVVMVRRLAYCSNPPFDAVGDADNTNCALTFSLGGSCGGTSYPFQAASFKSGMFASFVGSGRAGQETSNWTNASGDIFLLNLCQNAGFTGGFSEHGYSRRTDITWQDGTIFWESIVLEQWQRVSDGTFWCAATRFKRLDTDTVWTQDSPRMVSRVSSIVKYYQFAVNPGSLNYNRARKTPLKTWHMQGAIWDMDNPNNDGSDDPCGFFSQVAGFTPDAPATVQVVSATGSVVTVKVPMSKYMGRIRLKIDGTFVSGQDYIVKREDAEMLVLSGANVIDYKQFSATGLSLATGSHTVIAYAVNKNNTVLSTGVSTTFTV